MVTVGEWQSIPGGPDCKCSDGSPFEIWERPADPTKVMLYFEGGGACFSAETCGPDSPTYKRNLELGVAPDLGGVFDATNPENPIADWSIVYVPYCTGDVHLGDTETVYSDTVTIDHNGFNNADFGLQTVVADYPDVEQLLVAGSSAGSIPSPGFAGLAADVLPDAEIVTFGDSSAAYPDVPALNAAIGGLWGVQANIPDWPVNEGLTPEEWSMPGLYVQSGTEHPEITFARFDFAYDRDPGNVYGAGRDRRRRSAGVHRPIGGRHRSGRRSDRFVHRARDVRTRSSRVTASTRWRWRGCASSTSSRRWWAGRSRRTCAASTVDARPEPLLGMSDAVSGRRSGGVLLRHVVRGAEAGEDLGWLAPRVGERPGVCVADRRPHAFGCARQVDVAHSEM